MHNYVEIELSKKSLLQAAVLYYNGKQIEINQKHDRLISIINREIELKSEDICKKTSKNGYRIYDPSVINVAYRIAQAEKVKKRNKYLQNIIITTSLAAMLVAPLKKERAETKSKNLDDNNVKQEEVTNTKVKSDTVDFTPPKSKATDNSKIKNPVYKFSYLDRTDTDKINYVNKNYQESINKYTKMYGIDESVFKGIVSQENAFNTPNNSNIGGHGVTQIESVWMENPITAFNYETHNYDTEIVHENSLANPSYAIKIGCMILNYNYNYIYNKYCKDRQVLTKDECITAAVAGYNKGIFGIEKLIIGYGKNFLEHRDELNGGDNLYNEHVFSYVEDGQTITFRSQDGASSQEIVDNIQSDAYKK